MKAATSTIVNEYHQTDKCMYCGSKLPKFENKIIHGLERRVVKCSCGKEARIKINKRLNIKQLASILILD